MIRGVLIDTCIWIDVERGSISPADVASVTGDSAVYISPIILAKLTFGAEMVKGEHIHQKRIAVLNRLRKKPCINIDENTGDVFGRIAAAILRKQGRDHKYRIQDLWLTSQAIQNGLKLLTKNKKDFIDNPGLDLVILR